MNSNRPIYININTMTVVKILLIFVVFYLLFLVREVLAILFVALVLASAVDPWVDWLQKHKIPRPLSIIFIYLLLLSAVITVTVLIVPPIVEQTTELSERLPIYLEKAVSGLNVIKGYIDSSGISTSLQEVFGSWSSNFSSAAGNVIGRVGSFIGGIVSFFLILVITFYMVVEENALKKIVWSVAPEQYQVYIMQLVNRMQRKVGLWLRGQLILSLIIFTLIYIGLSILGVKYALVLALIAGMTEFVPYLGPTLAAVPAIFLAFTQTPMLGVLVALLYYVVQLTENNIIVPKLMQKVVGLNPIISIAVLLMGFRLGGVIGAVLSIPVATAASVFIYDVFERRAGNINIEDED